jgi:hypothetical protein
MLLFIPIIPILAIGVIASGIATLVWYADLSVEEQQKADRQALNHFGKKFNNLTKNERKQIKDSLS